MLTLVPGRGTDHLAEARTLLQAVESMRWVVAEFVLLPLLCACVLLAGTGRVDWASAFLVGAVASPMLTRVATRYRSRKR